MQADRSGAGAEGETHADPPHACPRGVVAGACGRLHDGWGRQHQPIGQLGSDLAKYEPGKQTGDAQANMTALQAVLATKGGGITVLPFSPAADQNAFVVRKQTATDR